jgi:hypothetical protein
MFAPPEVPRNAERTQSEGRVALVVEEEQRGQQPTHYKGRDTPKDNPDPGRLGSCRAYRGGGLRGLIQDPASELPRIPILRGSVNRADLWIGGPAQVGLCPG